MTPSHSITAITRSWCLTLLALAMSAQVAAQAAPSKATVRAWAAVCASCHGTEGKVVERTTLPSLVGLSKEEMREELAAFREGKRPATIMHQISKGLTERQIAALSDYFAALPR